MSARNPVAQKKRTSPHAQEEARPTLYRITPELFHRMGQLGLFPPDARIELVGGQLFQMAPIGPEHGSTVDQAVQILNRKITQQGYYIRVQNALRLGENELIPDLAIVPGKPSDYRRQHPTYALLVIEVADTSLEYDQTHKSKIYAQAGIPEYWIVNLIARRLEVYREPEESGYKWRRYYGLDESVSPLFEPNLSIPIHALFEDEE